MNAELAVFAGGCFWCTEAVFTRLKGVTKVVSGYAGGHHKDPSYGLVSNGTTGHAEAVQITYDPTVISYERLLEVFWATHNPTTVNQQGSDMGTQYRSMILYKTALQKDLADKSKKELKESHVYDRPIVTEIAPLEQFYTAEEYHQNYYASTPENPYCSIVISPKIKKLLEKFGKDIKEEYKEL